MLLTQPARYMFHTNPFMYVSRHTVGGYCSLAKDEKIASDDFIEDLATGRRESVSKGYWTFLRGERVEQALQLPEVFDVVRANA
jgi:hypothetical protein